MFLGWRCISDKCKTTFEFQHNAILPKECPVCSAGWDFKPERVFDYENIKGIRKLNRYMFINNKKR